MTDYGEFPAREVAVVFRNLLIQGSYQRISGYVTVHVFFFMNCRYRDRMNTDN